MTHTYAATWNLLVQLSTRRSRSTTTTAGLRSYRGLDGLQRCEADWEASWSSWRWEPEEFIDAGDRVVAVLRVHAKGRESGVDVERVDGAVWTLRRGKCIRLDYYGSKAEAVEAVGLKE
jgi:ketosteroid isomerase-like protein